MAKGMCSVEGCGRPARTNGLCGGHYHRMLRWGDLRLDLPFRRYGLTPYDRVMAQVEWQGDCLVWTGHCQRFGYGVVTTGRKEQGLAHRVVAEHHFGPSELHVLHSCDNPPCVNIEHLRYGTQSENMRDMVERGRHWLQSERGRLWLQSQQPSGRKRNRRWQKGSDGLTEPFNDRQESRDK